MKIGQKVHVKTFGVVLKGKVHSFKHGGIIVELTMPTAPERFLRLLRDFLLSFRMKLYPPNYPTRERNEHEMHRPKKN